MPCTIRDAAPDDDERLIALFRASVREAARRDYSEAQVRAWAPDAIDAAAWRVRLSGQRVFVAELAGELAGFAALEADGHLDMLFVSPAHQRRGVGSALLAAVEAAGPWPIVTEASLTARPLFAARGYRVLAPQTVELRGESFVNFRMTKE